MAFKDLPRCGAKARSNENRPCKQVAMANGRCYYHGGAAKLKHGKNTKMAYAKRRETRQAVNDMKALEKSLGDMVDGL